MIRRDLLKALAALPFVGGAFAGAAAGGLTERGKAEAKLLTPEQWHDAMNLPSVTYRQKGPWGSGKGHGLSLNEIDNNFYALEKRLEQLEKDYRERMVERWKKEYGA